MTEKNKKIFDNNALKSFLDNVGISCSIGFNGDIKINDDADDNIQIKKETNIEKLNCSIENLTLKQKNYSSRRYWITFDGFPEAQVKLDNSTVAGLAIENSKNISLNLKHNIDSIIIKEYNNAKIIGKQPHIKTLSVSNGQSLNIEMQSIDNFNIQNVSNLKISGNILGHNNSNSEYAYLKNIDHFNIDVCKVLNQIVFQDYIGSGIIKADHIPRIKFSEYTDISKIALNVDTIDELIFDNSDRFFKPGQKVIDPNRGQVAFILVSDQNRYGKNCNHVFAYHKSSKQFLLERKPNKDSSIKGFFQETKKAIFDKDYKRNQRLKKEALALYKEYAKKENTPLALPPADDFRISAQEFGQKYSENGSKGPKNTDNYTTS